MTAVVQRVEDVINVALVRIGYKGRVDSIYEGSPAADAALDIYGQTRDEMLRDGNWPFASRTIALTLLKQAPSSAPGGGPGYIPPVSAWTTAYPPPPWMFEYAYPADCIEVRAVKDPPFIVPNFDPQPRIFAVANDPVTLLRVILSNVPSAICIYAAQVTNPTQWPPDFVEAFAAELGRRLEPALIAPDAKRGMADEQIALGKADVHQG